MGIISDWFGRKKRDGRRGKPPRPRLGLEALEERAVPAVFINWVNKGVSDGFDVYANPTKAREVFQAAIDAWESVLTSFNYHNVGTSGNAPQADHFDLKVTARDLFDPEHPFSTPLGQAKTTAQDQQGKPYAGLVEMDDSAGGAGWYFSEVHVGVFAARFVDNAEFTDVAGRFLASRPGSARDFYFVSLHEIGHALGISNTTIDAVPGVTLTPAGDGLLLFHGATRDYTLTDDGHVDTKTHPKDLMNPGSSLTGEGIERKLITQLDADLLKDAYGFSLATPISSLPSFLATLDEETGVLTVRGDPDVLNDHVTIDQFFGQNVLVDVNGAKSIFPESKVTRIEVFAGAGNDLVDVEFAFPQIPVTVNGGDGDDVVRVSPTARNLDLTRGGVTVRGDRGNDRLEILDESKASQATYAFADGLLEHQLKRTAAGTTAVVGYLEVETLTLNGQAKDPNAGLPLPLPATAVSYDAATGVLTVRGDLGGVLNDHVRIAKTFFSLDVEVNGVHTTSVPGPLNRIEVYGGAGNDVIDVDSTFLTQVIINGGAGDDTIRITPAGEDLDSLVAGALTVRGGAGADRLEIHDKTDNLDEVYEFSNGLLTHSVARKTVISRAVVNYLEVEDLTLEGGSSGNDFDVERTDPGATVTLVGGAGRDRFDVTRDGENLDFVGPLKVVGGGDDDLFVRDSANSAGAVYALTESDVQGLFSLTRSVAGQVARIDFSGVDGLNVTAGDGTNRFDVEATPAGASVSLSGGDGQDTFRISATAQSLAAIAGNQLSLDGNKGTDSVEVYDRAGGSTYALNSNTLTSASMPGQLRFNAVENFTLTASDGGNAFDVTGIANNVTVTLVGGTGKDEFHVHPPSVTPNVFRGKLNVVGGAGADSLVVSDQAVTSAMSYVLNAGLLTRTAPFETSQVGYAGVESLAVLGGQGGNTFDVQSTAAGTVMTLVGGAGDDLFGFREGASTAGTFDGQGGADTLDYSARTTGVAVDLSAPVTRNGGFVAIENVIGSAGNDVLKGNAADNLLVGGGGDDVIDGGAGRDVLIGGRGADQISGGDGEDVLIEGYTAFDANLAALRSVVAEWSSSAPLATRVGHLDGTIPGGLNTVFLKTGPAVPKGGIIPDSRTVFPDGEVDELRGGAGVDWFFLSGIDLHDGVSGEVFTDTSGGVATS